MTSLLRHGCSPTIRRRLVICLAPTELTTDFACSLAVDSIVRRLLRLLHVALLPAAGLVVATTAAAADAPPTRPASAYLLRDELIKHSGGAVTNHVRIFGDGTASNEAVVIVPSLGRGVEDYTEQYHATLTAHLVEAGFDVLLIQPRGIGRSVGDLTPGKVTMADLANDLLRTTDQLHVQRAHFVGHAFGNRLARTLTAANPDRVLKLALLASGGGFALSNEQRDALQGSMDLKLSDEQRLAHIRRAFFAPGHDPAVWLNGWYPELARAQSSAVAALNPAAYKNAGGKPFLLVQALDDFIAPPDKAGRALKRELGE